MKFNETLVLAGCFAVTTASLIYHPLAEDSAISKDLEPIGISIPANVSGSTLSTIPAASIAVSYVTNHAMVDEKQVELNIQNCPIIIKNS